MDNTFNNYKDELYGKIYDFDGEAGVIVTDKTEYFFDKKDIRDNESLGKGDVVVFRVNSLPFGNEVIEVAKYIKKDTQAFRK